MTSDGPLGDTPGTTTVSGRPWPFHWRDLGVLGAWYVAMVVVYVAIGETLTRFDPIVDADERAARAFEDGRTATLDDLAPWAAGLSDTIVKISVTSIIVVVMRVVWKRWLEPAIVAGTLILEACVFITVTYIVGRPRPMVEQLQESPVNSSFPSGHVAAAAAYFAIAVVLARRTRSVATQIVMWMLPAAVTLIVAWARLYQGMHYVSDVVLGVVLGIWSVVVASAVLTRAAGRAEQRGDGSADVDQVDGHRVRVPRRSMAALGDPS